MVVKLETISALYADVYPTLSKTRGRDMDCQSDCARRQKQRRAAMPALVEDDSEETFEPEQRSYILHTEGLRRQKSVSPQRRERLRRQLVLPSLSEDEEPWSPPRAHQEWSRRRPAGRLLPCAARAGPRRNLEPEGRWNIPRPPLVTVIAVITIIYIIGTITVLQKTFVKWYQKLLPKHLIPT